VKTNHCERDAYGAKYYNCVDIDEDCEFYVRSSKKDSACKFHTSGDFTAYAICYCSDAIKNFELDATLESL